MSNLSEISSAILERDHFMIFGHIMPDGDSIGSVLALGLALKKLGKKVTLFSSDAIPKTYFFLPGISQFKSEIDKEKPETLIALDCSVPERMGEQLKVLFESGIDVINIDHHAGNTPFADISYIDPQAAATGEIIFDLLKEMKVPFDLEIAINLYTAILTDTGSFKYESTSAMTHRRVAELIEYNVPVAKVCKNIYDRKSLDEFKVLQVALKTLQVSSDGKVAWLFLDWNNIQKFNIISEYTEDLINYSRRIDGVEVAMLFREMEPGKIKVSFRSNDFVDVNKLANVFQGGGHKRAAGCVLTGNFEEIKEKVVDAALYSVKGEIINAGWDS